MNREEAMSPLDVKLDEYCKLSYDELASRVGDEEFPEVVGSSGATYQIELQFEKSTAVGGTGLMNRTSTVGSAQHCFDTLMKHLKRFL